MAAAEHTEQVLLGGSHGIHGTHGTGSAGREPRNPRNTRNRFCWAGATEYTEHTEQVLLGVSHGRHGTHGTHGTGSARREPRNTRNTRIRFWIGSISWASAFRRKCRSLAAVPFYSAWAEATEHADLADKVLDRDPFVYSARFVAAVFDRGRFRVFRAVGGCRS